MKYLVRLNELRITPNIIPTKVKRDCGSCASTSLLKMHVLKKGQSKKPGFSSNIPRFTKETSI